MLDAGFYDLIQEATGAIYTAMFEGSAPADELTEQRSPLLDLHAGRAESAGWFLIQAAEFAPEALTVARLRVRDVYGSERVVTALLEMMTSELWLDRVGDEYSLTATGQATLNRSRARTRELAARVKPLPDADLKELVALMGRLIQASLASATPPGTWCLAHSRNRAPTDDALEVLKLFQYNSDFNAFRDDAHMAAWMPYERSGAAWEAFSLICSGEATSAEAVVEQLAYRGFTRHEYATALADLSKRGWLEPAAEPGIYKTTEKGWAVRADVERLTDAYFYAPWSCLREAEVARVHHLLEQIQTNLQPEGVSR